MINMHLCISFYFAAQTFFTQRKNKYISRATLTIPSKRKRFTVGCLVRHPDLKEHLLMDFVTLRQSRKLLCVLQKNEMKPDVYNTTWELWGTSRLKLICKRDWIQINGNPHWNTGSAEREFSVSCGTTTNTTHESLSSLLEALNNFIA